LGTVKIFFGQRSLSPSFRKIGSYAQVFCGDDKQVTHILRLNTKAMIYSQKY